MIGLEARSPDLFLALMMQAVASPMMAAPAFAASMGLDATLVLVSADRKGKLRPAVMVGGGILLIDGKDLTAGARKPKVESIFEVKE